MSVDEVRDAVERTVPSYRDRTGDWASVIVVARPEQVPPRSRWLLPAAVACAVVVALLLFWPGGTDDGRILERALAAVDDGPVIPLLLEPTSLEFYELATGETRREPIRTEIWFDAARGVHSISRVEGKVIEDVLQPPSATEVDRQFLGLAAAYRRALRDREAAVEESGEVDGRHVYWISFQIRYPDAGIPTYMGEHAIAVDAASYEPRAWRADGRVSPIRLWETLSAGSGDFAATAVDDQPERWYGVARVGMRTPEAARGALSSPALWLGPRFQELPLSFIREVRYESGELSKSPDPDDSLPGLELCYGSGEPCAVLVSETTKPNQMAGRGHSWQVTPPPGTVGFDQNGRHAYLVEGGVYITIEAEGRETLIAAAKALTPIP